MTIVKNILKADNKLSKSNNVIKDTQLISSNWTIFLAVLCDYVKCKFANYFWAQQFEKGSLTATNDDYSLQTMLALAQKNVFDCDRVICKILINELNECSV